MNRKQILETASKMVNGDREEDYGSPENNFETIAALWRDYIHASNPSCCVWIDAKDVAAMLMLLKVARIASGHAKSDNWVDAAGYAACGGEIESGYVCDEPEECKGRNFDMEGSTICTTIEDVKEEIGDIIQMMAERPESGVGVIQIRMVDGDE